MPGTTLQRRVVRRDVPDVLLDDDLQQQDDHDHPRRLEEPFVQLRGAHAARSQRAGPGRARTPWPAGRRSGCARAGTGRRGRCCRRSSCRAPARRRRTGPSAGRRHPASSTSRRKSSSCRPLNSGLTACAPLGVRSKRNGGYSCPSIDWDFSRPPSIERQHPGLRAPRARRSGRSRSPGWRCCLPPVAAVGAQEAVGEPLREEQEHARWCRPTASPGRGPPEQLQHLGLGRQRPCPRRRRAGAGR